MSGQKQQIPIQVSTLSDPTKHGVPVKGLCRRLQRMPGRELVAGKPKTLLVLQDDHGLVAGADDDLDPE